MENIETNKDVVRKFNKAINEGNMELMNEVVESDFVHYDFQTTTHGPKDFMDALMEFREAFPDFNVEIQEIIGEGGSVVNRVRFTGTHKGTFVDIPATGNMIDITGLAMFHIRDGKIYEHWTEMNGVGLMQQLKGAPPED
jgi:steroid delta-isomerase-like uncharacterized protein